VISKISTTKWLESCRHPYFLLLVSIHLVFVQDTCSLKHRKPVSSFRSSMKFSLRTRLLKFSDTVPANLFPRTTTSDTSDYRWLFDMQSTGWEVRTGNLHQSLFLTVFIYCTAVDRFRRPFSSQPHVRQLLSSRYWDGSSVQAG
jgi:hypothetical protein